MGHVQKTAALLLLCSLTGCASGPFHRKTAPAPALQPQPPELSQTPLYSPEMSDGNPKVPSLPPTAAPKVQVAQPVAEKPKKTRKPKPTNAKNTPPAPKSTGDASTTAAATVPATSAPPAGAPAIAEAGATTPAGQDKPAPTQQAVAGEAPATSPIGELTAGDSAEAAQTSHQAADLIRNTKAGVDGIKRDLTPDEKKTVTAIGTFLKQAEQALKNGDVDGAYGLATKAKILLDELTQK